MESVGQFQCYLQWMREMVARIHTLHSKQYRSRQSYIVAYWVFKNLCFLKFQTVWRHVSYPGIHGWRIQYMNIFQVLKSGLRRCNGCYIRLSTSSALLDQKLINKRVKDRCVLASTLFNILIKDPPLINVYGQEYKNWHIIGATSAICRWHGIRLSN